MNATFQKKRGMTLIETLVAISILSVAIVGPMTLVMQSLSAAYYARDGMIAFHLAQEAIESVRSVRDGNILRIALSQPNGSGAVNCSPMTILCTIPLSQDFIIDARDNTITICSGQCTRLQTDDNLYGYASGWRTTQYRRTVNAVYVGAGTDEIRVTVTVAWQTGPAQQQVVLYENLYKWIDDGAGT